MANPQPDQFTRISNELYRAIMQTDFSKRQRNILDLVIRMSYGCGKKFALLRPVDFELVGVYKTHVKRELDYLCEASVLAIDGDQIILNKNYNQWRISLSKTAIDPDKWSAVLSRNLQNKVTEKVTKTHKKVTKTVTLQDDKVTKTVTDGYQNSNSEVTKTVTDQVPGPSGDGAPSLPKESIKESIKERSLSLAGKGHSPPAASEIASEPPTNQQLIAELVQKYRDVGAQAQKGDYPFIGRLYNEFGYDEVLVGINALGYRLASGFRPNNPLIYLGGIVRKGDKTNAKSRGDPGNKDRENQYSQYNALFNKKSS